jgi:hypothetical protein
MEQEIMAIYDPVDDARLETDQPKKYISSWAIRVEWDNGETEDITDIPPWASEPIDEYLSSIEEHRQEEQE